MADTTVDSLQIEIEANSSKAAEQVNKLSAALERLKQGISGSALSSAAKQIKQIGNTAQKSTPSQRKEAVEKAASGVNALKLTKDLERLDAQIGKTEGKIAELKSRFNALVEIESSYPQGFGDKEQTEIDKISQALSELRAQYKALKQQRDETFAKFNQPIDPEVELTQIEKLKQAINELKNFKGGFGEKLSAEAKEAKKAIDDMKASLSDGRSLWKSIAEFPSGVLDSAKTKLAEAMVQSEGLAKTIHGLQYAFNAVAQPVKKFASVLSFFGKSAVNPAVSGLKKLGNYVGSKFTAPFQKAVGAINKVKSGFGRIMFYRAIRGAIQGVTQGFKEGIDNLYQYSLIVGTKFAPAMDSLATSALYLKNSLGAMVAPIIQQLAPAVDYLVDRFVDLTNAIGKAVAALTGQSVFSQAKKYATEYAEAAGDAAKATKSFTIGLDELNIIEESTGRGGKDDLDYGSMFEEVDVPELDWVSRIKEAIENGQWYSVGAVLAKKLNEAVSKLDLYELTSSLGEKISNGLLAVYGFMRQFSFSGLGETIAKGLNGLFDGVNFGLLGMTFATKWNAMVNTIGGFIDEFNWKDFGLNISNAINGWFEEVNWSKAGETLSNGILGVFDTLQTVLTTLNWAQIGADIAYFLNAIDWVGVLSGLGTTIAKGLNAAVNIAAGLAGTLDWGEIGGATAIALTDTLNAINFADIGTAISNVLNGALDFVLEFLEKFDFIEFTNTLFNGIGDAVEKIDIPGIAGKLAAVLIQSVLSVPPLVLSAGGGVFSVIESLFESIGLNGVAGFFKGIGDGLTGAATWLKVNLVDPIVNWVKDLFGIHSPSTVFAEIGGFLIQGLWSGIVGAVTGIYSLISGILGNISSFFLLAWNDITKDTKKAWEEKGITGVILLAMNGLKNAIKTPINAIIGFVETLANSIIKGLNTAINALNNLSFEVPDWVPGIGGGKLGFNIQNLGQISIPRLASGGVVDAGQLFIANEAGPELVGNIGSKTGVANTEQIVTGIREGVRDANEEQNALLREQNELLRALLNKDNSVRIGDKDIKRAYDRASRNAGASIMPGGVLA